MRPSFPAFTIRAFTATLLLTAASLAMAEDKVLDRTFTATPGGLLTVSADGAHISVNGGDANQVIVHMVARAPQKMLDALTLSATQTAEGVIVEMRRSEPAGLFDWGSSHIEGWIEVTVPRNYRVEGKTSGGDMRLENTVGNSRLRTSGGNITVRNLKGDLNGHTSGGYVRLESVEGAMDVKTSGGDIRASTIRGDIDASTSGGNVRLTGIDGRILARTSGGSVEVELVGVNRGISTTASGGSIELTMPRNAQGTLEADSNGGRITSDFAVGTAHQDEHRLYGEINGGGDTIRMRTSGGGIRLVAAK